MRRKNSSSATGAMQTMAPSSPKLGPSSDKDPLEHFLFRHLHAEVSEDVREGEAAQNRQGAEEARPEDRNG